MGAPSVSAAAAVEEPAPDKVGEGAPNADGVVASVVRRCGAVHDVATEGVIAKFETNDRSARAANHAPGM